MTDIDIRLDRLGIDVRGVPAQLVEVAMGGLGGALQSRLGDLRLVQFGDVDIADLALSPITLDVPVNAEALRSAIVERLIEAITQGQHAGGRG